MPCAAMAHSTKLIYCLADSRAHGYIFKSVFAHTQCFDFQLASCCQFAPSPVYDNQQMPIQRGVNCHHTNSHGYQLQPKSSRTRLHQNTAIENTIKSGHLLTLLSGKQSRTATTHNHTQWYECKRRTLQIQTMYADVRS